MFSMICIFFAAVVFELHWLYSCKLTVWQRSRLWGRLSQLPSYDRHFARVVTFRDPWKIYPVEIQEEMA
jgi:hypothetical protein